MSTSILQELPQEKRDRIRQLLDQVKADPPQEWEVEEVLDEFLRFYRFAAAQGAKPQLSVFNGQSNSGQATSPESSSAVVEEEEEPAAPPRVVKRKKKRAPFQRSGDPFEDLQRLWPFQVAGALKEESPKTAAIVLGCLPPEAAGEALELLPEELQAEVFLALRDAPKVPAALLERIVETTVTRGANLDTSALSDPQEEANKKLAEVLRAMGQQQRGQILKRLEETAPESVIEVKRLIYIFEDLMRVSDRSIQKVLAEVDASSLARALKGSDPDLLEKVMRNLSKRARATLAEEIEFSSSVKPEAQELAQQEICTIIARMDQSGDLEMEE